MSQENTSSDQQSSEMAKESKMVSTYSTVELLVPIDVYLSAGVHIGTYFSNKQMERYIYRVRPDGLYVLDVRKIDERLRIASRFLARFEPQDILVVGARQYSFKPIEMFSKIVGTKYVIGRFLPGTLTNPNLTHYVEPEVLLVTDPKVDSQPLEEAVEIGVPVVAFISTDARIYGIDLAVPANNKGRKSLALLYYILARQILREKGLLGATEELPVKLEEFETRVVA